ncbi:hypothetical protein H1R20_g8225, partial [Candolleomyces eurysporus]
MSSDNYFDDEFDDAAFAQMDAIEAAALQAEPARPQPRQLAADSSIDLTFDIDESELQKLDDIVAQEYNTKVLQVPGPSSGRPINRTGSSNMLQTTLFGDVLPSQATSSKPKSRAPMERTKSATRNIFGQQAPKTKTWDHTAFAQSGLKRKKPSKGKGKGKATEEEREDDDDGFELPAPYVPVGPPPPMKQKPDLLEAKHWIFPINRPKRDYQFNIVKNCLFDNTLVALPTGLGKTFVAGVVMLNYYRWFPEGKIVFVAPTKPLVAQQIIASHETCGIPGSDATELTGQVQSATRSRYWQEKRVFYMTPQTLESDLESGICDPMDIVLLVIDEAHHATGDYSYNKVVRFMMAKNPHFRLLALTATPGNNTDAIQTLIDGLHISKIEIRNENSLDLKPYIFEKVVKSHIIKATGDVFALQELLLKTMDPFFKPAKNAGLFYPGESLITMHPFRPMMIANEGKHPLAMKFYADLSKLSTLARSLLYLVRKFRIFSKQTLTRGNHQLTGSVSSSREYLEEIVAKEEEALASGKKRNNLLTKNPSFQNLMKKFDELKAQGSSPHPKMEKLRDILINYFGARMQDPTDAQADNQDDTRVMVFSSYRAVVDEIIQELNRNQPLIRAAAFIGQSSDKKGRKGLKQKEQIELIERFQKGEFNVLVATSIGEEGLDIGEIDLTVCYDTDKAPTRMIQRFGRTGRKRAGEVHVLLAEAREEFNLDKAKEMYKEVQKIISRGELYELYGDVPRLLPDHVKPECVEKAIEMQPFRREDLKPSRSTLARKGTKRKRNTDPNRNIPPDMPSTFTSANSIWKQFTKKRQVDAIPEDTRDVEELGEDDDVDKEIESGVLAPVRRTQSDKPQSKKRASSPNLPRSATAGRPKTKKLTAQEKKMAKLVKDASFEDLAKHGEDDDVDLDIQNGIFGSLDPPKKTKLSAPSTSKKTLESTPSLAIEVSDSEDDIAIADDPNKLSPKRWEDDRNEDMGWLVDDDEDMLDTTEVTVPPVRKHPTMSPEFDRFEIEDESIEISQAMPLQSKGKQKAIFDAMSSPDIQIVNTNLVPRPTSFLPASKLRFTPEPPTVTAEPRPIPPNKRKTEMLPPPVPSRKSAPSSYEEEPEPTFPVKKAKRRRVDIVESSDGEELSPRPQHRLRRQVESTPVKAKKKDRKSKRAKPSLLDKETAFHFDGEAAHSGDEVSEGFSEEDEERSSDREFIKDSPLTQRSPSYQQTQIYRQSLFTQAPMGDKAPVFASGPARARPFGRIGPSTTRNYLPSSSPPPPDEELDQYEFGSFIVADEGDISLEVNSEDDLLDL